MRYSGGRAVARSLALEWLRHGGHEASATYLDRTRAVGADEALAAVWEDLHPDRMCLVVIGPLDRIRSAAPIEGEPVIDDFTGGSDGR